MSPNTTRIEAICLNCNSPFLATPWNLLHGRKYCSRSCGYEGSKIKSIPDNFWSNVLKTDSCWLWQAGTFRSGYGRFLVGKKRVRAPRFAWELTFGPIPDGFEVCHNCPGGDNPLCCNPDHLFLGTHDDNMKDMVAKGRSARGEDAGRALLTEQQVLDIRLLYQTSRLSYKTIGELYKMSKGAILAVIRRRSWQHLP